METIGDRIKKARKLRGLTQEELGKIVGVKKASVSQWESGLTKQLIGNNLIKTAIALRVVPEWLTSGKGEMDLIPKSIQSNISTGPDLVRKIPLISFVSAGKWCEAVDNYAPGDAEEWLDCVQNCGGHTYALRVKGDSMTNPYPIGKSYPDGSIIYVDPEKPITNGCRVIAKLPHMQEAVFKEYVEDGGKKYLRSINPQYPLIEITENTRLCGVVICKVETE